MTSEHMEYKIIDGKTYSLFAGGYSPEVYYKTIASITDEILQEGITHTAALDFIRKESNRSGIVRRILSPAGKTNSSAAFEILRKPLFSFTKATREHLKQLPILKFWDQRVILMWNAKTVQKHVS